MTHVSPKRTIVAMTMEAPSAMALWQFTNEPSSRSHTNDLPVERRSKFWVNFSPLRFRCLLKVDWSALPIGRIPRPKPFVFWECD